MLTGVAGRLCDEACKGLRLTVALEGWGWGPFCSRFFLRAVMIPMFLPACMSLSLLLPTPSRGLGQRPHRQGWRLRLRHRHRWPGFGDEAAQGQRGLVKQR